MWNGTVNQACGVIFRRSERTSPRISFHAERSKNSADSFGSRTLGKLKSNVIYICLQTMMICNFSFWSLSNRVWRFGMGTGFTFNQRPANFCAQTETSKLIVRTEHAAAIESHSFMMLISFLPLNIIFQLFTLIQLA